MAQRGLVLLLLSSAVLHCRVVVEAGATGENGTCALENPTGEVSFSVRGVPGPVGPQGPQGASGPPGPKGEQGQTGGAVLSKADLVNMRRSVYGLVLGEMNSTVQASIETSDAQNSAQLSALREVLEAADTSVLNNVMSKLSKIEDRLTVIESKLTSTKCGITALWRRVAYLNTVEGDSCPSGLQIHSNPATKQRACGRSVYRRRGCSSLQFPTGGNYRQVCGRVRGYQDDDTEPFKTSGTQSIDDVYLDGVSITQGSPRRHLWSYVSGEAELDNSETSRCPCARSPINSDRVPSFVGTHYYCESGFSGTGDEDRIAWEDPLWDGAGCTVSGNRCCDRFGWFHRQVSPTSDNVEIRWCGINRFSRGDVLTDQLEIWVV